MANFGKKIVESVRLDKILNRFNAQPKLTLKNVKQLKLSYAFRNDHFGARHFVKDFIPRISYANPEVEVEVERIRKLPQDLWKPVLEVVYQDGTKDSISMHEKWSTAIAKELMDKSGADAWKRYKQAALASGQPIFAGEENEGNVRHSETASSSMPSLNEYKETPEGKAAIAQSRKDAMADANRRMNWYAYMAGKKGIKRKPGAMGAPKPTI